MKQVTARNGNKKHAVMTSTSDRQIVWQIRTAFYKHIIEHHDTAIYDLTIFADGFQASEFYLQCVTHRDIEAKIVKHV